MPLVLKIFRQKFCLSVKCRGCGGCFCCGKIIKKTGYSTALICKEEWVESGALLISAEGMSEQLHQAWKVVQLVLEWSCGVAQYTAEMIANAKSVNPTAVVACTRKSIPNTRKLATNAVLAAGGHIHRQGVSETLLVLLIIETYFLIK